MNLKMITDQTCPSCNARTTAESCRDVHTNGQPFETRTFACGSALRWSPNFHRLEVESPCPKNVEEVQRRAKRAQAYTALETFLQTLDVDDKWKAAVLRAYVPT